MVSRRGRETGGFFTISTPCQACGGRGEIPGEPCPVCGGTGRVMKRKTLVVRIDPGVDTGSVLRLRGEGEPGLRGGPPGDLYIKLEVDPHPHFQRDGLNILYTALVPFTTAALGGEIRVPTIHGERILKIPAGIQSGQTLRMRGMGIKKRDGTSGDQLVRVEITVPKKLSRRQKELMEELARISA